MKTNTFLIVLMLFVLAAVAAVGATSVTPEGQVKHYHINDHIYWDEPTWDHAVGWHYGTGQQFVFAEWGMPALERDDVADCSFSPTSAGLVAHDTGSEAPWHDDSFDSLTNSAEFSYFLTRHVIEVVPPDDNQWWFALTCDIHDDEGETSALAGDPPAIGGGLLVTGVPVEPGGTINLRGSGFDVPSFLLTIVASPVNCASDDWPTNETAFPDDLGQWHRTLTISSDCASANAIVDVMYGVVDTRERLIQSFDVTLPSES